ncbi:phage holin [Paenibacillus tarimensis]
MQNLTQPYISAIVQALFGILAIFVLIGLKATAKKVHVWLDAHTTAAQRNILHMLAKEGFAFSETMFGQLNGEEKLQKAMNYVTQMLQARGIQISGDEIRAAIEKAVLAYKTQVKPADEPKATKTAV